MGSTIPEMLQATYLFLGVRMGWVLRRPNFCPQDIAPPGTAHSRFKTGSAYTCYLLQEIGLYRRTKQAQRQLDPPLLALNKFSLKKLSYR